MTKDQRFNSLLNRYVNNVATLEEQRELMKLIREGNFNEELKDKIDTVLREDSLHEDMPIERAQAILQSILSTEEERRKIVDMGPWKWVAAAAVLVIAVSVGWFFTKENNSLNTRAQNEVKIHPSVFSGKQFVHLPDGSTVILNEGSQLNYGSDFGTGTRTVTLTGEAFFDIQHDPLRPFKVVTGEVTTTVLGTAFNVTAYPGQKEIKVTVSRGKVQVANKEKVLGIIIPDQQIAVNTTTDEYEQTNTKAEEVVEWKAKYLIFDDMSMETAAAIIEEKYNRKVVFSNHKLRGCRISATFLNGENIEQVMNVISGVLVSTYKILPDGNIQLDGKGCN